MLYRDVINRQQRKKYFPSYFGAVIYYYEKEPNIGGSDEKKP